MHLHSGLVKEGKIGDEADEDERLGEAAQADGIDAGIQKDLGREKL